MSLNMSRMLKWKLAALVIVGGTMFGVTGNAANGIESMKAYINHHIKLTLNGNVLTLKDREGTELVPLIMDGNSYLPAIAIGEALGANVQWDESTKTISITTADDANVKQVSQNEIRDKVSEMKSKLRLGMTKAEVTDFIFIMQPDGTSSTNQVNTENEVDQQPMEDSRDLQLQDMLVLELLPHMREKLAEVYSDVLSIEGSPQIHPYSVDVRQIERVSGFRGFDFLITLEVQPTVGPHIPVGEDTFTFRISASGVELKHFEHLRGPNKDDFLPNYQNLLK
jgi:hypothetical protein